MENLVGMYTGLRHTYAGKKVFLTGHTGFKGAWLLKIIAMLGADVRGYALAPTHESGVYQAIKGDQLCSSILADIRDENRLKQEISAFQPDFIFHLAAQPLVRLSYQLPKETFDVNAMGTANLLEGVRLLEKPCSVVLITTDKVYQNKEWLYPYRENDRLGGFDPYSASKACTELIIESYRNSFFNTDDYARHQKGIAVARAGNVIGGGDWADDRIVPDIVRALHARQTVLVRNPQAVRPWQHVLEPLSGYLLLGMKLAQQPTKFSEAYNFGPSLTDTLTVEQLVQKAIKIWGSGDYQCPPQPEAPHEAGLLRLDSTKALTKLGWQPRWTSERALNHTLNWYKTQLTGGESIDQTVHDILQFYGPDIS